MMKSWWVECERNKVPDILDSLKKLGIAVIESLGVQDNPKNQNVLIAVKCMQMESSSLKRIPGVIRYARF